MNLPKFYLLSMVSPFYGKLRKFDEDLVKSIDTALGYIQNIFKRGISFGDNFDCQIISYTTNGSANTEDSVSHTLKRIPEGFLVANVDKSAVLYSSGTAWTKTAIFLKCSEATTQAKVIVF